MINKALYPPLAAKKSAPKVIRFVYKKNGLVVFLCPLIHTNKIVTIQPPNIAKISLEAENGNWAHPVYAWL
jgi:hypothetical protein